MATKSSVKKRLATYRKKRDFEVTGEPAGGAVKRVRTSKLQFVIQKHAATNLHFDLRLELDGVMKSWAVPKGPSLDPSIKRLAMEVEDHPMEYNSFEGVIPKGEYGGGTVMIWDQGTYSADKPKKGSHEAAIREGYSRGKIDFTFHGERVQGSFALIRTQRGAKPQWLLIKHRDEHAAPGSDVVAENMTSVVSGQTMPEIAGERSRVWHSDREPRARAKPRRRTGVTATSILPMLATPAEEMPEGDWTYEPKFDGIRVLAYVTPGAVRLITRNAKDKTAQFPEIVTELKQLTARNRKPLVLDGEIVALIEGEAARFQYLQGRMHLENARSIARLSKDRPAVFVAFDLLLEGDEALLEQPWHARRKRLEKRLGKRKRKHIWLADSTPGGEAMLQRAASQGWEGVIAKQMNAPYTPGKRTRTWLKLKLENRQEFVVGGYTEPRKSRKHIGALLLGYYDDGKLVYVGHTGGGFSEKALQNVYDLLAPLEGKSSPFTTTPRTNEKAHWVKPQVVVEVRYNELTNEGKLRQPVFLGVREDKDAKDVHLERPR
ncbi:MAG: non-homologous end-joining DNA ligase [Gemmatimonadota bacterium]